VDLRLFRRGVQVQRRLAQALQHPVLPSAWPRLTCRASTAPQPERGRAGGWPGRRGRRGRDGDPATGRRGRNRPVPRGIWSSEDPARRPSARRAWPGRRSRRRSLSVGLYAERSSCRGFRAGTVSEGSRRKLKVGCTLRGMSNLGRVSLPEDRIISLSRAFHRPQAPLSPKKSRRMSLCQQCIDSKCPSGACHNQREATAIGTSSSKSTRFPIQKPTKS